MRKPTIMVNGDFRAGPSFTSDVLFAHPATIHGPSFTSDVLFAHPATIHATIVN